MTAPGADAAQNVTHLYRAGTLAYTRPGLVVLFAWLLWGDFVFTFMEAVLPSLLPLLLKDHGANNREIIIIVSTLSMVMNAVLNPVISYNSDRFRSRWGRRRPFIFLTTPFVVLFLSAIPFAPEILRAFDRFEPFRAILASGPAAPLIIVFGILVAGFQVFNMFVSSVYYYLIPDVVPQDHLGRFYALFRVFGSLAGVAFNYYIFGLAESHMREIFVGTAVLYGIFMAAMCWRVKEGDYPPLEREHGGSWWSGIANYGKECFGCSYYWWVFFAYSALTWAGAANVFAVFFSREELGITLDMVGKIGAWSGIAFMVAAYPIGVLIDRWGSHRTLIAGLAAMTGLSLGTFFFAVDLPSVTFWTIARSLAISISAMALLKWTVDVYPRDRYGQFGSAGALFSSIGGILLGPLCGWFMDWIHSYRYFLIWSVFFSGFGVVAAFVVYRKWQALGGVEKYQAP